MDPAHALYQLPLGHAVALRLHDRGVDDDVIADALGVPVQTVPGLLVIARTKLAEIVAEGVERSPADAAMAVSTTAEPDPTARDVQGVVVPDPKCRTGLR